MDIDYIVATYLSTNGFGTLGTSIYIDQIEDGKNGIFVTRSGGQMNNYVPIEESIVDIYIKNTSATTCKQTLEDIKRFIHRMHSTEVSNAFIYTFLVIGDIQPIGRDLEQAKIYKLSVQVVHRNTGLIS